MDEIPMKPVQKSLSSDCWEAIFSYLGDEDLKAVSLTCKDFLAYSNPLKKSLNVVHPQISMLSRHLNRFSNLKTIDLLHFQGDIDKAIREIARSGIELEALLHTSFSNIIFEGEVCITEMCSNLKVFSFTDRLGDCDFAEIGNYYPNLEELGFETYRLRKIAIGSGLEVLASKLRLLKKIHLFSYHVSDQFIVALSFNCVLLKEVSILSRGKQGKGVTENAVGQLLQNRPNLEALFVDCIVKDDSVPVSQSSSITIEGSISHAKALTALVLGDMSNTDKVLMEIAKAKLRLNNLGLSSCSDLTVSRLLLVLSNHLTKLRIDRCNLTNEDMEVLVSKGDVGKLTHLEINRCLVTRWTLFLLLAKCPSLVDIRMTDTVVDRQVQNVSLSENCKIQSLYLEKCFGINDELLEQLGRLFPNLKVLDLSCCYEITTKNIQAILKRCKHVKELNLAWFKKSKMIEEDGSESPHELNLEVLNLSNSDINDEGLVIIAKKCPRLVSLNLDCCKSIRTEGVKQVVENIKTLRSLNLMYYDHISALLEWMLSTGNFASLKKVFLSFHNYLVVKEQRDQFLQHGCLLLSQWRKQI